VEELVGVGAKVDRPEKDGFTPLFIADKNGHSETVEVLKNFGAKVYYVMSDELAAQIASLEISESESSSKAVNENERKSERERKRKRTNTKTNENKADKRITNESDREQSESEQSESEQSESEQSETEQSEGEQSESEQSENEQKRRLTETKAKRSQKDS
jgi:ankyrin repeat protein